MKIAYLMQSDRDYEEIIETLNQLTKQEDHVFIMINDNDLRDKVSFVYAGSRYIHISRTQEYAQEGDLSLARGTIIQMKEALEYSHFDYFINLTDSMIPIKTRSEIVSFLEANNGKDFYYVDRKEDEALRKKAERFYTFTNLLSFPNGKFTRAFTKANAAFLNLLGFRRKLEDSYIIGSPWFIISKKSAVLLAQHFSYVAETFKLSWYPEEMYIPMMMHKFVYQNEDSTRHINKDMRVVGPDGNWTESSGAKPISEEIIKAHPEALFAGKINIESNLHLYETYFDKYNEDYNQEQAQQQKEKTFIDPEMLKDALHRNKQ